MPKGLRGFQKGHGLINGGNTGNKHSDETRKKMSLIRFSKPNRYWLGKKHSNKTKKIISDKTSGENSVHWKGGVSKTPGYKNNMRRKAKLNTLGYHTGAEWELLKKQYGNTCPCCHKCEPEIKLTEDHIIPLSKGGSDFIENIQPLCLSCNCRKQTKIIRYKII